MNFRRPRNWRHVTCHDPPRRITDRIDRSHAPGGGEERELENFSMTSAVHSPHSCDRSRTPDRTLRETFAAGDYCTRRV